MTLPIFSYGHSILKERCEDITPSYPDLDALINNMWETLYGANGCGLAAPQIGKSIRLFLVDSKTTFNNMNQSERKKLFESEDTGIVETFINARILRQSERTWTDEEGCLSIPNMTQQVSRPWSVEIEYYDKDFKQQRNIFAGSTARMIQHEYDHIEGILYLDYLSPLKRKIIQGKLRKIATGQFPAKYPMKYLKKL